MVNNPINIRIVFMVFVESRFVTDYFVNNQSTGNSDGTIQIWGPETEAAAFQQHATGEPSAEPTAMYTETIVPTETPPPNETRQFEPTQSQAGFEGNYVRMPNLVGLHYRDAVAIIEEQGLSFSLDNYNNVCDFQFPLGTIKRQEPEAGQLVPLNTKIILYRTSIPNIMGSNEYGNLIVYAEKGTVEYAAELHPGQYSLRIAVWTASPGVVTTVEFYSGDGEKMYEYTPNASANGRGSFLQAGPTVQASGCYTARLYYHTFPSEVSNTDFEKGVVMGWIEIEEK